MEPAHNTTQPLPYNTKIPFKAGASDSEMPKRTRDTIDYPGSNPPQNMEAFAQSNIQDAQTDFNKKFVFNGKKDGYSDYENEHSRATSELTYSNKK